MAVALQKIPPVCKTPTQCLMKKISFVKMHQVTDLDLERFMIYVGPLAAWKNIFHDNRMAKYDVALRQTLHVFSDSPGICQNG